MYISFLKSIESQLLKQKKKEITQTTVVIAYIIIIYLNQLADFMQDKLDDEHEFLHKEFYEFLNNTKVKVN